MAGCAPRVRQSGGRETPRGSIPGWADAADSPAPPAAVTEIQIDKSYWHPGFKVTLGTARIVPASFGGRP